MTSSEQRTIDAANRRVDQLTEWLDRVVPLRGLRPLERIPSLKLKLSVLIVAAILITVATMTIGVSLGIRLRWSLAASVLLALVLVQILARGITSPLRDMAMAADRMTEGDLRQRVPDSGADEVGQLGRSFNDMAAHIADLERQRRDLIANVSHDLRTPIAVIQGNVENLLDGVGDDTDGVLEAVLRQTRRLGRMVEQLLDLSRLEADASVFHRRPVDLVGVAERVIEEAGLRDPAPLIVLEAPDRLPAHVDPERFHQVLANLVDNAVRYQPPGEPIRLVTAAEEGGIRIVVEDRGPGIAPDELDRVFERFHRAEPDRASASGGSGLGLAIARSIVELHGGTIRAGRGDPTGCVMTITLPHSLLPTEASVDASS